MPHYCRVLSQWSPEDGPRHVKVMLEWKSYHAYRWKHVSFFTLFVFILHFGFLVYF